MLWLAFAAICFIWGSTYFAIKVGLESFHPFWFAALRYLAALPLLAFLAYKQGAVTRRPLSHYWSAFGVGVLFIGVSNAMVFWAETRLDSSYTALLITGSPVWTALLSALLGAKGKVEGRLSPRGWLGMGLGFMGSYWLLQPSLRGEVDLLAALVVEASVVVWALGAVWVRFIRERYHPLEMATAQMMAGTAALLLLSGLSGAPVMVGSLHWKSLAALGYLVIFGSVAAFVAYFYLLRHWPATRVAVSAYVNPVVAVALGALLLQEPLTFSMVAATGLILAGVSCVLRGCPGA